MKLTTTRYHRCHWHLGLALSLSLLLTACAPATAPAAPSPTATAVAPAVEAEAPITDTTALTESAELTESAAMTDTANVTDTATLPAGATELSTAEQAIVTAAIELVASESGVAAAELTLLDLQPVDWPDASLGCPQPETMYMQVITPGYQLTLQDANGTPYAVHTSSEPSSQMVFCQAPAGIGATEFSGVLTGTVTYLQRIALPTGSVINIELQDVSRADAVAELLATQTLTTTGENVPIPFELTYDTSQIDPRFTYAVRAQILVDGALRWTTTERYAVLTNGHPTSNIEVLVMPVE